MNQLPKVTSGSETKKFWSKVKQSSKGFSSSFNNLSLNSEHDGSTEKDTIVHKAMVNYYSSRNMNFPDWLGVVDKNNQAAGPINQNNTPYQSSHVVQQHRPTPQLVQNPSHERVNQVSESRTLNGNSKYSLSDIYNKAPASDLRGRARLPQPLHRQQQQQQPSYSQEARTQDFHSRSANDENRTQGYGGLRTSSNASNRLKERSMKQNKQSFDNYANNSSSSFASHSNTSSASKTSMWRRN